MKTVSHKSCSGFSLVELMVALLLGTLLTTAVIALFITSNRSYTETERAARLQENARFAMHALKYDLDMVKFFGKVRTFSIEDDGSLGVVSNDCTGDAAAYDHSMSMAAVQSSGSGNAYGCITDAEPGTTVLVVKHARPLPLATGSVESSKTYVLANHEVGILYDGADTAPTDKVPDGWAWEYQSHVYYIRKDSNPDTPPSLSRKVLQWNGSAMAMQTEDLVSGIEDMRLLFGVDSSSDGSLDSFFDAATINASTTYDWDDVGAVQVHLLVRSDEKDLNYTDTKTYNLGTGSPVVSPDDHYRRTVIHTTVSLRNPNFVIREEG